MPRRALAARRPFVRRLALAGALAALSLAAPPALAQTSSFTVSNTVGQASGLTAGEIEAYARVLGLDEGQAAALDALFEAYRSEFTEARVEMEEAVGDARAEAEELGDWQEMVAIISDASRRLRERAEAAEERLVEDMKLLLTDGQRAELPSFERTRRRMRTIDRGTLSGESVDLVALVDDTLPEAPDADGALRETLERYEVDLDRALVVRNDAQREQSEAFQSRDPRRLDVEKMTEVMERIREASEAVRSVNHRYARRVESALPSDEREVFADAYRRACHPRIYRDSYVDTLFGAVAGFEELDDAQRLDFDRLRERYGLERAPVDDRWAEAVEESETAEREAVMLGGGGAFIVERGSGEDGEDPVRAARDARRDLDRRYIAMIRERLAPELRDRLPERERRRAAPMTGGTFQTIETAGDRRRGLKPGVGPPATNHGRDRWTVRAPARWSRRRPRRRGSRP